MSIDTIEDTIEIGRGMPHEVEFSDIDPGITPELLAEWDELLDPLIQADNEKFGMLAEGDVLVGAGRYSPVHRGQALQIYAGAKKANLFSENPEERATLVIVVGSPMEERPAKGSRDDLRYPFSFAEREKLLTVMFKQLRLSDTVIANNVKLIEIRDKNHNEQWVEEVIGQVQKIKKWGEIKAVLANDVDANFSTRTAFEEFGGKRIFRSPRLPGQKSGTEIRASGIFDKKGGPHIVIGLPPH